MSSNLGLSTTPASGVVWNDFGSGQQYWSGPYTMPSGGGIVTDIYVYIGGDGVSFSGNLCIWGSSALLWASGSVTFPSNPRTNGGQQWLHASVPNLFVPAGSVNLGVWAGGNIVMTQEASGTMFRSPASVGGSPTALPGSPVSAAQALGAYIVYGPAGGVGWASGGTYHKYGLKRWNNSASAWRRHPLKRWNATTSAWEWIA